MIEHHRRMIAYDAWANGEALASFRACGAKSERPAQAAPPTPAAPPAPPARAVRVFAHVVGAERLWLARIAGEAPMVAVWPAWPLDECAAALAELAPSWRGFFDRSTDERLADPVAYTNSKGEPWTSTVGDIITHVVAHSAHHRGQIASELRAAGHSPAYTDFIHAVRSGQLGDR